MGLIRSFGLENISLQIKGDLPRRCLRQSDIVLTGDPGFHCLTRQYTFLEQAMTKLDPQREQTLLRIELLLSFVSIRESAWGRRVTGPDADITYRSPTGRRSLYSTFHDPADI